MSTTMTIALTIVLLGSDGTRREVVASRDVIDAGVVKMDGRYFVYRSSTRFVEEPLFEEVQCYEHCTNEQTSDLERAGRQGAELDLMRVRPMPHQDAVARLLFSSWADVGMRLGMPNYGHLTATERQCVSETQVADLACWVAERATVFCIRVLLRRPTQTDPKFGWLHAGDELDISEIDENASAPSRHSHGVKRVLSWPTRELAQRYADRHGPSGAEVVELTVSQLWEACRA